MFGFWSSEVFMGFVKSYIQLFAYNSVTTEDWKAYLFTYFKDKVRSWLDILVLCSRFLRNSESPLR